MWTPEGWYQEARSYAQGQAAAIRWDAENWYKIIGEALPGVPRAEIARRISQVYQQRLDALPSLTTYPELRGMRQLIEAQRRGTADGAGLDLDLDIAASGGRDYYLRGMKTAPTPASAPGVEGCTRVFFPTSEFGPLLGYTLDVAGVQPPGTPEWPAISEHLLISCVSANVWCDEESPEIFPAPVWKIVARYARTTEEALEIATRYNLFWGGTSMIVVDQGHNVAMIDKTNCRIAVRRSPDSFGAVTAMYAQDPALHAFIVERREHSLKVRGLPTPCEDTEYWKVQDKRGPLLNELMGEARKAPSFEMMRRIIQFRSETRGNVAGNGEEYFPGKPGEHSIRIAIYLLREGKAIWWARDHARNIPAWENQRQEMAFKDAWKWG